MNKPFRTPHLVFICICLLGAAAFADSPAPAQSAAPASSAGSARVEKICGVYTNVIGFASPKAIKAAVEAQPPFLMKEHRERFKGINNTHQVAFTRNAGFNTLFMTLYPLWGIDWWDKPAARGVITDAVAQCRNTGLKVHLGLSLFNGNFCADPSWYPGASRAIQCDGTRPSWVCFFDDGLWNRFIKNCVEMAKVSNEYPDVVDGVFVDPESYGPECYLCFCPECIRKFNAYAKQNMPEDVVKPDGWLKLHGLWKTYTVDWHDQEVLRHANHLRKAVHAVNPKLQLSSLLWDYPVAVGINDARQAYFRNLVIGLGTPEQPSWTLPEHTYYSNAADLDMIIKQIDSDLTAAKAQDRVKILPGLRVLRRPAASLIDRGHVIHDSNAVGYWMYELSDLQGKGPIDFEGSLIEPPAKYIDAFREMNRIIRAPASAPAK
jgi:hypothetical protein